MHSKKLEAIAGRGLFPLPPGTKVHQVLACLVDLMRDGELIDTSAKSDIQILQGVEGFLQHAEDVGSGIKRFRSNFYIFTGSYWMFCESENLAKYVSEAMAMLGFDEEKSRTSFIILKVKAQLMFSALTWDPVSRNGASVNCANGTVRIMRTGKVRLEAHDPEDYYTYCLPYDFNQNAVSPKFDRFLKEALPGESERLIAFEAIGAAFVGDLKLEKMVVMLGSGANGKSVYTDVVSTVLGAENVCHYPLDKLEDEKVCDRLDKYLLNYGSEIGEKIGVDMLKRLASREPILARGIYASPREVTDYCRFVFNANSLPFGASGNAYARRFVIVPWNHTVKPEDQNPDLANEIIEDETPAVLNHIIDGALRLIQNKKYTHSAMSDAALHEYTLDSDSVAQWLDETGYTSTDDRKPSSDVYSQYSQWAKESGRKPVSSSVFGKRLKGQGIGTYRDSSNRYYLIGFEAANASGSNEDDAPF